MASRLAEFRIEGLFGLYQHKITLNREERITIIIGPNGRGKTVCLKLIEALFHKRLAYFKDIPFLKAEFSFTGGEIITIDRVEELFPIDGTDEAKRSNSEKVAANTLKFKLSAPGEESVDWSSGGGVDIKLRREIRRYMPGYLEQVSPDLWIDQRDGEEFTALELAKRFAIPSKLLKNLQDVGPERFIKLVDQTDCHLIEAQRLLVLPSTPSDGEFEYNTHIYPRRRPKQSTLAIQQKAQTLKAILQDTLTSYANLSQSLDRTFPIRVFEAQDSPSSSQEILRRKLKDLDNRREALMSAGILVTQHEAVSLRSGEIQSGVVRALEIYVEDAGRKLDVFNDIRDRLDLFKEIIEKRFIDKTIHIDREKGFKITSKTGSDVPLEKLSSGEQHQLILVFDLLFEVKINSLILIDEPELSLHVAWQKTFIKSLQSIIALNAFDVLIATHSPAVISRHPKLVVELGSVDE